jgi:hypothetical protein
MMPGFLLDRLGLVLLGVSGLRVLGFVLLSIGTARHAAGMSSVRAPKTHNEVGYGSALISARFLNTGGRCGEVFERYLRPVRASTALTVEGHHCRPPCAVGTPFALSSRAISPRVWRAVCAAWIRSTTCSGSCRGRPRGAGAGRGLAGRRRSARSRSSSSTGISRAPQGISIVSTYGRTRRMKVERLTPSASVAWLRV